MLLFKSFLSNNKQKAPLAEQYKYLRELYNNGSNYILLNCNEVFRPYPKPIVSWDISELQKIVIYDENMRKLTDWINRNIVLQLDLLNHDTFGVLVRIATGMLNKIDIQKNYKLILHEHMVKNLRDEFFNVIVSDLPFIDPPEDDKPF